MDKHLIKILDLLEPKGKEKKIVITVTKEDRNELKSLIKSYVENNGAFEDSWTRNLNDETILDKVNYLFFSNENKTFLTMRRSESEYKKEEEGNHLFFPAGTFFNEVKGIKKKLEL